MTNEPTKQDNSEDQELAAALADISGDATPATDNVATPGLNFEETPTPSGAVVGSPFGEPAAIVPPQSDQPATTPVFGASTLPVPDPVPTLSTSTASTGDSGLDTIKKDALNELRPLVDKLTVPPEEKFDTYLLLLRSTDDTTLIGPAHDAAKEIPDEARRAQALLDIIKEIDYLSAHK